MDEEEGKSARTYPEHVRPCAHTQRKPAGTLYTSCSMHLGQTIPLKRWNMEKLFSLDKINPFEELRFSCRVANECKLLQLENGNSRYIDSNSRKVDSISCLSCTI